MAETLGSLCDKLTVVKLKQWHSEDSERQTSLAQQCQQLQIEIDEFFQKASSNEIPIERLRFAANKVFKGAANEVPEVKGTIGYVFAALASVNCELWHQQEKVYEFENVPIDEKDAVVSSLAKLNLTRNLCIDEIDRLLAQFISNAG